MSALTQVKLILYHRYVDNYAKEFDYQINDSFIQNAKEHLSDDQVVKLEQDYGPDIVVAYLIIQARKDLILKSFEQMIPDAVENKGRIYLVEDDQQIYDWLTKVFSLSELTLNGRVEYLNIFDQLQSL